MREDQVGVALWSLAAGACAGAAAMAGALVVWRLQAPVALDPNWLTATLAASLMIAVASTWFLAQPIADTWRRAVAAALAGFGTALLGMGGMVADMAARVPGLVTYAVVLAILATVSAQRARNAA